MGTTLASYFMAVGAAVPVVDERPGRIVALDEDWSGAVFDAVSPSDDHDIKQ